MNTIHSSNKFPRNFWVAVTMEFFERGSYYGMMSVLAVFLVLGLDAGGLGFSKEQAGAILGTIPPLLYFLPIIGGAAADRFGYRKILYFAFACMIIGYGLTGFFSGVGFAGTSSNYAIIFSTLIIMAVGAGFFKPVISGTIAKSTTPQNAGMGFGIFYWMINLGAFLFPLFLVPWMKSYSYNYIFYMSAAGAIILMLMNIFLFKEPQHPSSSESVKPISVVFKEMLMVLKDWKFMLLLVLYAGFWVLYFQVYGTVLWFLDEYIDMAPINRGINSFLSLFTDNPDWHYSVEHVTAMNAGFIICLQLIVSKLVTKAPAVPTMILGIGFGTVGIGMLAISNSPWFFLIGMFIFTLGEMTAHPKYNAYVGMIAPSDKKALYMGYSFLCSVIGSSVGGFLGSHLYVKYIGENSTSALSGTAPQGASTLWIIFAAIGVFTMVSLALYHKFLSPKKS